MPHRSSAQETNQSNPPQSSPREPIAIIGIGCRFPGGADGPEKFWSLVSNGVNAVSEIPSDRIDLDTFYDPRPATPGKMMTRWGGFLQNIDQLDADFFGISPREAERLDPQQRLLLEVAWEAVEDAGWVPSQLSGSQTGVFVGLWLNDFKSRLFANPNSTDFYMTTGSGRYSASGRISYIMGFQGPSITIDTACSSSLVAVNLACQSLWTGQCSLALAGGANVILQPQISIAYSQSKMMAADGRCKFGDAGADGYVRSEGAGLVVLKRLSQALADDDPIYALIRGGAVNNDGSSSGFLATPSGAGQEEMLRLAYRDAGIDPHKVQYVEAHGTGTKAGDPVELGALGAVLGKDRSSQSPLWVGSVKTNLGHTEGAAGVAGLIKVTLALKHGMIPASLHLQEFNPAIPWTELNLTVPRAATPWQVTEETFAGVSTFGIVGTNAHMVLSGAPQPEARAQREQGPSSYVLPLSAHTPQALKALMQSYISLLDEKDALNLVDLCYSTGDHRTHHPERLAIVAASHQQLKEQLVNSLANQPQKIRSSNVDLTDVPVKVVFIFPGQGAQWLGMGRDLLKQNPVFRDVLTQCAGAIKPWVDWSLLEQLELNEDSASYRLNEIGVIQPVLFALEIALAAVWQSWGVEPSAVIGHSMGETAAAYVAGALTLEDAAHVICRRSQLMQRTSGNGAMAVIGLSFSEAQAVLKGHEHQLSVAVYNSPRSVVLSGEPQALNTLMEQLKNQGVFCRAVRVDVASHSPQMDPLLPELASALQDIQPKAGTTPIYSTVTEQVSSGAEMDAHYWEQNMRQPVRFQPMIEKLLEDEITVFIEMSPHPIL